MIIVKYILWAVFISSIIFFIGLMLVLIYTIISSIIGHFKYKDVDKK